jgi:oxalate decarboxylase
METAHEHSSRLATMPRLFRRQHPVLTDFLAYIPKEVLAKNFGVPERAFANIPKEELYIFESKVPGPLEAYRVVGAGQAVTSLATG